MISLYKHSHEITTRFVWLFRWVECRRRFWCERCLTTQFGASRFGVYTYERELTGAALSYRPVQLNQTCLVSQRESIVSKLKYPSPILIPKSVTYCTCHFRNASRKHRRTAKTYLSNNVKHRSNINSNQTTNHKQDITRIKVQQVDMNTDMLIPRFDQSTLFLRLFRNWSGDKIRFLAVTKGDFDIS